MKSHKTFSLVSFLSPLTVTSRCRYTQGLCFSRILGWSYGPRTGGGNTGFPLKKELPHFAFCLSLDAWILAHSFDSALAS